MQKGPRTHNSVRATRDECSVGAEGKVRKTFTKEVGKASQKIISELDLECVCHSIE